MTSPSTLSSILLLVLFQSLKCSGQSTTMITWKKGSNFPTYSVAVGDTARFVWSSTQNIYRHPSGSCDTTDSVQLAPTISDGAFSYTFEAGDEGKSVTFASQMDNNCENGMLVTFNVGNAVKTAFTMPDLASAPQAVSPAPYTALSDTLNKLELSTNSGSSVSIQKPEGSTNLAQSYTGEYSYKIENLKEQGAVTFSCDLGAACPEGMAMKFSVGSSIQNGVPTAVGTCECVTHEDFMADAKKQGLFPVGDVADFVQPNGVIGIGQNNALPAGEWIQLKGVGGGLLNAQMTGGCSQTKGAAASQHEVRTVMAKPEETETRFLRFQFTNSLQHLEVAEDHVLFRTENPDIPVPARNITIGDVLLHPYNLHGPDVRVVHIEIVSRESSEEHYMVDDPHMQAQNNLMNLVLGGLNKPFSQGSSLNTGHNLMYPWCGSNSRNLLCIAMKGYVQHASRLIHWGEKQSIIVQWTVFPTAFVLLSIIYFMECLFYFGKIYSSPMLVFFTLIAYAFATMPTKYRFRVKKFKKY